MKEYTISNVMRDGEWQGRFGPMVTIKIAFEGEEGWHRMNQKQTTALPVVGAKITGVIGEDSFPDGEKYKTFKKVNPEYAGQNNQPQQQSQAGSQEAYIVQMLEELTGRRSATDQTQPDVVHPVDDGPIDPNDIPF